MTYLVVMIEQERRRLQELSEQHGTTSQITIECRKKLDYLLTLLDQTLQNKRTTNKA